MEKEEEKRLAETAEKIKNVFIKATKEARNGIYNAVVYSIPFTQSPLKFLADKEIAKVIDEALKEISKAQEVFSELKKLGELIRKAIKMEGK